MLERAHDFFDVIEAVKWAQGRRDSTTSTST
jgi:hypothetical protein